MRLAQRAARQHLLVAEWLLAVNQHNVLAAARQFPVLKSIVQQQGVATKVLDA